MNHQFAINGFRQYFWEHYGIFKIIKHILSSDQFITQEQHDTMVAFTKGEQAIKYIYTYLINTQLSIIYVSWKKNPQYCKDASMIHNKISEIICPQWKFNCVISVRLQHKHFAFPVSSPNHFAHTLRFNDAGIVFFFFLSTTADVTWHRRWHRHRHRIIPMHHN